MDMQLEEVQPGQVSKKRLLHVTRSAARESSMRASIWALVAVLSSGAAAYAQEVPELSGTWSGTGPAVSATEGWEASRSASMAITEQRGRVFRGEVKYEGGEEDFVGVIQADGKTILMSNDDGNVTAYLSSPSEMEVCYIEGGDEAMAACTAMTRAE
ncbi:hypothetical protein [Geminicoccus harenae]|uniref:hypothetical protein n=1 Tax=Geminicoccus harenae TaxID=2498453 RepID=UPI00168ABCD7|nr:hypothetical protein [Geminicoccus harenae]